MGNPAAIPLSGIGPQTPNPFDTYARILGIKNAGLQQQGISQENQMRQLQMDSQRAIMDAYQQSNGDLDKTLETAAKSGKALPSDLFKLRQTSLAQREMLGKITTQDLANHAAIFDRADGILKSFKALPPEQQAQQAPAVRQQLSAMSPDLANILPPDLSAPGAIDGVEPALLGGKTATANELKRRGIAAEEWKKLGTGLANTATGQTMSPGPGQETPEMQQAAYNAILAKKAAGQQLSPDELAFAQGMEAGKAKTTSTSDSLGIMTSTASRPTGLASVGAGPRRGGGPVQGSTAGNAKDSLVDLIGQYKANPELLGRMLYRHPEVLGMLHQKYPDFDETNYVAKNKLVQGYTSGKQSGEINAINTVAGHLDALDQAVAALNNRDTQALNKIGNAYQVQMGATPQATFQAIVHRIGPEITKAYISGGGGEGERFANENDFSPNLSPQQLHGNIATTVKLLRSKIGALENQYKQTVGRDDFSQRFITPAANQAFTRLAGGANQPSGGGAGGFSVKAPNGKSYTFKDQQSLDAFKKAAGLQ